MTDGTYISPVHHCLTARNIAHDCVKSDRSVNVRYPLENAVFMLFMETISDGYGGEFTLFVVELSKR